MRFDLPKQDVKRVKTYERSSKYSTSGPSPMLVAAGLSAIAASMDKKKEKPKSKPSQRRTQVVVERRSQPPPSTPTPRNAEKPPSRKDRGRASEKPSSRRSDRSGDYEYTRTIRRTTRVWY